MCPENRIREEPQYPLTVRHSYSDLVLIISSLCLSECLSLSLDLRFSKSEMKKRTRKKGGKLGFPRMTFLVVFTSEN